MGLAKEKGLTRGEKEKAPARENRIAMEIVVDASGAEEQAMDWYCYLADRLEFPFPAKCVKRRDISPLLLKEKVHVVGMASEAECEKEMFVSVLWCDRKFSVPLDQWEYAGRDKKVRQAVGDWHYWVRQGYRFG